MQAWCSSSNPQLVMRVTTMRPAGCETTSYPESILVDGFYDQFEGNFGGEGVTVVDDGFSFISIPAVQFHAAAALI